MFIVLTVFIFLPWSFQNIIPFSLASIIFAVTSRWCLCYSVCWHSFLFFKKSFIKKWCFDNICIFSYNVRCSYTLSLLPFSIHLSLSHILFSNPNSPAFRICIVLVNFTVFYWALPVSFGDVYRQISCLLTELDVYWIP